MYIATEHITDFCDFHETLGYVPEDSLFFDIETTGLSPASSALFLIGALRLQDEGWQLTQYLAEEEGEEEAILRRFFEDARPCSTLIHFNGNTFDLPFLRARAAALGLESPLPAPGQTKQADLPSSEPSGRASLDLYQRFRALRAPLGLSGMNQTALEAFVGWQREDDLTGKHMIALYQAFCKTKDPTLRTKLLLHNHDDLVGMTKLLQLAAYALLFSPDAAGLSVEQTPAWKEDGLSSVEQTPAWKENGLPSVEQTPAWEENGLPSVEQTPAWEEDGQPFLQLGFRLGAPLPAPLSADVPFPLQIRGDRGTLHLPCYQGELKYFFPDWKNYFYLPLEDQAIHRRVGAYLDPSYRIPAQPDTCYTRREGRFCRQPDAVFSPVFRKELCDPALYFEYTDALCQTPSKLQPLLSAALRADLPVLEKAARKILQRSY